MAGFAAQLYDERVPNSSGTDKFRAISRVVGRQAGQSRWTRATYQAGRGFLSSVGHVLHTLFHQVTGFFFLVFGLIVGLAAYREYVAYADGKMGPNRAILAGLLALLFVYFALSSFARSGRRKK